MQQFESVRRDKNKVMELRLLQIRLLDLFSDRYRRIWVERSRYSLLITVFPIDKNSSYQMFIKKDIYHGFSQETTFEECLELLNQ